MFESIARRKRKGLRRIRARLRWLRAAYWAWREDGMRRATGRVSLEGVRKAVRRTEQERAVLLRPWEGGKVVRIGRTKETQQHVQSHAARRV